MCKKYLLMFIASVGAIANINAQTRLIEKVERKGNELVIPYEKYQLSNGLTVVVHEDHSDPIVHVDVTYHVGSAREEVGKSGFAHFFEHMMFQGSDNVADEQHFKIVSEAGGTLNGTTNLDRTNYYETLPSNQLEVALWLEADRMGFLLDAVTQQKFEVQRSTVKNERGQRYDNAPYGLIFENLGKAMYPFGHPYSWQTIGYLEDLNRVDVNDLKKFFLRWYGPNNAVVTVGGDVNPENVVKLVEKYFGSIPVGPAVENVKLPAPVIDQDRYISYEDNNIRFPGLLFSFPTVPSNDPDQPALDCLAEIIGIGKNSFFYKNFVKTQKAIQSSVINRNSELAGSMTFFVLPFPGQSLSAFDTLIRQSFEEFEKSGVTDDAIQRFKANYEANTINSLASVAGKVGTLADYQTFTGNPNYLQTEMSAYAAVTKEDVLRVYNKYIKGQKAVILSIYPKGKPDIVAKNDNFKPTVDLTFSAYEDLSKLVYNKPVDTAFDRSKKPTPGANPVVKVLEFYKNVLANGVKVIGANSNEIPSVTIQLTINGGHRLEQLVPEKAGIADMTASLMNEGTKSFTSEELNNELDKLGSNLDVSAGDESILIRISSLKKNLDATLKLAEEVLLAPRFAQEDFDRLKKQQLEGIADAENQPVTIADNTYAKLLYGSSNIMALPVSGTEQTVSNITLDDIKNFYAKYVTPSLAELVIVGDIDQQTAMNSLAFLSNWTPHSIKMPVELQVAQPEKTKIYLVNKEKAPQSEIRIGYLTNLKFDAVGEYYKATLMNYVLGGAFNSRINLNLREDKGYTYGARSGFASTTFVGDYTASAGVRSDATAASVIEFMKEINNYRIIGITAEELEFMKNSIGQRDARNYETPGQKAGFLRQIIHYNLDKNFIKAQNEILKNMSKDDIDALARRYLPADNMYIVVVGDAETTKPELIKLGYDVVELDTKGNILN